jgi:predicted alpha/beta-hydrolase family hydrolase
MPSDSVTTGRSSRRTTEQRDVDTSEGLGRWYLDRPPGFARAQLLLGHGAGGGVGARDLEALAVALPAVGVEVARFEQPWRLQGRKVATAPPRLDAAWMDAVPSIRAHGVPLVVGGRSAGARVGCRTARSLDAQGVLALAFPLHPPGRPDNSRAAELPELSTLVVQGERDRFGTPAELTALAGGRLEAIGIPAADHSFAVPNAGPITEAEALELITSAVTRWMWRLIRESPGDAEALPLP